MLNQSVKGVAFRCIQIRTIRINNVCEDVSNISGFIALQKR